MVEISLVQLLVRPLIVSPSQDALILAKKEDFDVFNALDLMENKSFLENLKFGIGDGNLQVGSYFTSDTTL